MATDWGYTDSETEALVRLTNLVDEMADSTADNEELRMTGLSDHATASNHELDSGNGGGDAVESLTVMGRPETVKILVQNATGNYSVDVAFDNTSLSLVSASSTNSELTQDVFSNTTVDVTISDDSGASNTVDYDILLI